MARVTVLQDSVIPTRLPDSASVFTAEIWAIIEDLKPIKDSVASKYIIFLQTPFCDSSLYNILNLEHRLIGMVIRKFVFLNFAVWVPSHIGIRGNEKQKQPLLPSLFWIYLMTILVCPIPILNIISADVFFPRWLEWCGREQAYSVTPVLGDWKSSYWRCGKDEVVL